MDFGNSIGHIIDGKYRIERQLGKGGMGTVYLATHLGTERPVAVKLIAPQFMERAEFVERFRREARAAGRLRHPNVVDVTDFGIAETRQGRLAYLVMEYLDGCTLGEILEEEKQLPLSWSLDILEQVCSAVHAAHEQGIIHRDLKPDNIWLEPNQRGGYTVKVLDFGIAKLEEHHHEAGGEDIHISVLPTIGINFGETVSDGAQTATIADAKGGTMISEKGTAVFSAEAGTLARTESDFSEQGTAVMNAAAPGSEKGTAILAPEELDREKGTAVMSPAEIDLESGTAILPGKQTQLGLPEDGTRLVAAVAAADQAVKKQTTAQQADLTRVGAVLGTPLYMSPEQCRGERLTARSDIYSLGVIAYQMLDGKTPFEGDFTAVMQSHREAEPPRLAAKKVPRKVKRVVHAALAKNADERPETAQAFASKLRSHADGIGALLNRSLVIYSERLPKFLLLTFLTSIPILLLSVARAVFNFLVATGVIGDGPMKSVVSALGGIAAFFVQIFTAAFLVGLTTWIVSQILAVPLRPISLKTAYKKARERWKPLLTNVTVSTLIALLSWGVGGIAGALASAVIGVPLYLYVSQIAGIIVMVLGSLAGFAVLGIHVSSLFMLIAPAIMMEGVRGRAAFRRSRQLVRRAYKTVLASAILNYVVPGFVGFILAFAINGIVNSRLDGFEGAPAAATEQAAPKPADNDLNIQVDGRGLRITNEKPGQRNEKDNPQVSMRKALTASIFELIWAPIGVLIMSFTSVITALIYLKTRQAGGESMNDLLAQFEDDEQPKPKWQQRVQDRLVQSGRITSKT